MGSLGGIFFGSRGAPKWRPPIKRKAPDSEVATDEGPSKSLRLSTPQAPEAAPPSSSTGSTTGGTTTIALSTPQAPAHTPEAAPPSSSTGSTTGGTTRKTLSTPQTPAQTPVAAPPSTSTGSTTGGTRRRAPKKSSNASTGKKRATGTTNPPRRSTRAVHKKKPLLQELEDEEEDDVRMFFDGDADQQHTEEHSDTENNFDESGGHTSKHAYSDAENNSSDSEKDNDSDEDSLNLECRWRRIKDTGLEIPAFPDDNARPLISPASTNPIDLFNLFVNDAVIELIVVETNRYALMKILDGEELLPGSRGQAWHETDAAEIRRYLGICLVQGLVRLPCISDYWAIKSPIFGSAIIRNAMPRDRFLLITANLHFADNAVNLTDPLHKLRPLTNLLNERFGAVIEPGRNLVIDESMRKWRGRLRFRVYNPNKSNKYGIKLYKLTTVDSFVLKFKVFCGSETYPPGALPPSQQVVVEMAEQFLDAGRSIYGDNWYSGIPLAERLADRSTYYCGTVRRNRKGLPADVAFAELSTGEAMGRQCQHGTKLINWLDKRNVLMLTTIPEHTAELEAGTKQKPKAVLEYNDSKKGIDVNDQLSSYQDVNRKGLKWYRKLALDLLLNTCVINAWILQSHLQLAGSRKLNVKNFRVDLAVKLLAQEEPAKTPALRRRVHTLRRLEGLTSKVGRRCVSCYAKLKKAGLCRKQAAAKAKNVPYVCDGCVNTPHYCVECFNEKHRAGGS